jgi:cold-inducible RNA-binding protein
MTNIYVGNLSFDSSEDDLANAFGAYGTVDKVSIVTDRMTGRSRGFAFVEMSDDAAAKAAIDGLNGKDLGGRVLTVNEARPKTDRRDGGGGGRGGYGGGGYR